MTPIYLRAVIIGLAVMLVGCKDSAYDKGGNVSYGLIDRSALSADGASDASGTLLVTGRVGESTGAGASVSIYPIVDGLPDFEAPLATAITDSTGHYSFALSEKHQGTSAVIQATRHAGRTRLRCSSLAGCGDELAFGDEHRAGQDQTLTVLVPQLRSNRHYNPTLLTELAYALADNDFASGDDQDSTRVNISDAQTAVASRFNVIGALSEFPVVDITSTAEISDAGAKSVFYSTLGPALLSVLREVQPGVDDQSLIEDFKRQYSHSGIAEQSESESEVTLYRVYERVIELVSHHGEQDLSSLLTELQATQALLGAVGSSELEAGTPSRSNELSPLERAKTFVQDIRQIAYSLDTKKLSSFGDLSSFISGDASEALSAFGVEIDAAELVSGDQVDLLLSAFGRVVGGMVQVLGATYTNDPIPDDIDGLRVAYSESGNVKTLTVSQSVDMCEDLPAACPVQVNLTADIDIFGVGGLPSINYYTLLNADIRLVGELSTGQSSLQFLANDQRITARSFSIHLEDEKAPQFESSRVAVTFKDTLVNLPFVLTRESAEGPYTLQATLNGDLKDADLLYHTLSARADRDDGTFDKTDQTRVRFNKLAAGDRIGLVAKVDTPAGEDFQASVNMRKDHYLYPGNAEFVNSETVQCTTQDESACHVTNEVLQMEGETQHLFLGLNLAAVYKANLKGIPEPVEMSLSLSRETHERNRIDEMKVTYPGSAFALAANFTATRFNSLDAVNLDGVRMAFGQESKDRSGTVDDYDGSIMAQVKDMGQWIKITFQDGYFEAM